MAAGSSETFVPIYQNTRYHIAEDHNLDTTDKTRYLILISYYLCCKLQGYVFFRPVRGLLYGHASETDLIITLLVVLYWREVWSLTVRK
jgi:hypothetical protein